MTFTRCLFLVPFSLLLACETESRVQPTSEQPTWVTSAHEQPGRGAGLVFTDEDGDDSPDRKEYLFTRSGTRQRDHSTHSFVFGPDGKLYWNMGNLGWYVHDREGNPVIDQAGNDVVARFAGESFPELRGRESPYQGGMGEGRTGAAGAFAFGEPALSGPGPVAAHQNFRPRQKICRPDHPGQR